MHRNEQGGSAVRGAGVKLSLEWWKSRTSVLDLGGKMNMLTLLHHKIIGNLNLGRRAYSSSRLVMLSVTASLAPSPEAKEQRRGGPNYNLTHGYFRPCLFDRTSTWLCLMVQGHLGSQPSRLDTIRMPSPSTPPDRALPFPSSRCAQALQNESFARTFFAAVIGYFRVHQGGARSTRCRKSLART